LCATVSSGLSPSPTKIPRLSIVMGAGAGGDAGQLTRSPGSSSASLAYVVTVDSALALAQLLQASSTMVQQILCEFFSGSSRMERYFVPMQLNEENDITKYFICFSAVKNQSMGRLICVDSSSASAASFCPSRRSYQPSQSSLVISVAAIPLMLCAIRRRRNTPSTRR